MSRKPCSCCSKEMVNRGAWSVIEDQILIDYIKINGEGKWGKIPKTAGLKRSGKSCRLRWLNYLRPDIKRGNISQEEMILLSDFTSCLETDGSLIAGRLPGRTDNEIKNYWNSTLSKKVRDDRPEQSKDENFKKANLQSMAEIPESTAIRTKAFKCCKCFISQGMNCEARNIDSRCESPKSSHGAIMHAVSEETRFNNSAMEFDIGEFLVSDICDSELWNYSQFNNTSTIEEAESNEANVARNSWLFTDEQLQFSEEMLNDWIRDDV